MRFKSLSSLLLASTFFMGPASRAAGMILIDPAPGMPIAPIMAPVHTPPRHPGSRPVLLKGSISYGLRLQAADIKVDIKDQVAKTYITQTFINDTDRNLAGTYLFPLPEDTTFSSFSLHIDGKPVEGKILEAKEARQQYEEIVRRMVDPGLLEYADYKTVRARIFPIPAHGTKKVELEYTQLLRAESGLMKYRFPLKTEGSGGVLPAEQVNVNVKLLSKQGLRTIWSPTHSIDVKRADDHGAKIAYLGKNVAPDKDFMLYYSLSDKDIAANVLTHKDSGEDGYYLMTLAPPVGSKQTNAKDIILVADTSGSMAGVRMAQNKKALEYFVKALNPEDRFNIIGFNTDVDNFKSGLVAANAENKKHALDFISEMEAHGGTNIGDALKIGGTMLDSSQSLDRPGYLVLMTDGEPTVGTTSIDGLLKSIHTRRDIRVFDFGVGYDVNTKLLNKLAESHHGTSEYVEPEESLETALSGFYNKIKSPVLTNVKIAYSGIEVKNTYPREVKDIFAGSQVLLIGRYKNGGSCSVKLSGMLNGAQKTYSFPMSFANDEASNTYLPRIWAMRRIGYLTDIAQDNGNNPEVVNEIIALSKKYGIISQYTSFLVTDPNDRLTASAPGVDFVGAPAAWTQRRVGRSPMELQILDDRDSNKLGSRMAASPKPSQFASRKAKMEALDAGGESGGSALQAPSAKIAFYGALGSAVGKDAVKQAKLGKALKEVEFENQSAQSGVKSVENKTFYLRDGFWVDSIYDGKQKVEEIEFGSKAYFDLLHSTPALAKFFAIGHQAIIVFNGHCFKVIQK
jgi:uncharacterized protein YegL